VTANTQTMSNGPMTTEALLRERRRLLGGNVSVAYRKPLHITRGSMQYLWDADGRRYLDAYNNVPHVGHCHPRVVQAGQEQMARLNTNTRYLHELVNRYAERLTASMPPDWVHVAVLPDLYRGRFKRGDPEAGGHHLERKDPDLQFAESIT